MSILLPLYHCIALVGTNGTHWLCLLAGDEGEEHLTNLWLELLNAPQRVLSINLSSLESSVSNMSVMVSIFGALLDEVPSHLLQKILNHLHLHQGASTIMPSSEVTQE